jgi:hypothetical protein
MNKSITMMRAAHSRGVEAALGRSPTTLEMDAMELAYRGLPLSAPQRSALLALNAEAADQAERRHRARQAASTELLAQLTAEVS